VLFPDLWLLGTSQGIPQYPSLHWLWREAVNDDEFPSEKIEAARVGVELSY